MADLKEIKTQILQSLRAYGIEDDDCRREAELIIEHATGWKLSDQILRAGEDPGENAASEIARILEMRGRRLPLQYCLGFTDFMALRFLVRPGVFIPRPDTETLVQVVLQLVRHMERPYLLEIGSGSGAICVSLLKHLADAQIVAVDVSADAVSLTGLNATTHGVADRLITIEGDWQQAPVRDFDGIVSNPPYIPRICQQTLEPEVREYEPDQALYGGGDDGLDFYRDLCASGIERIKPGGFIAVEVGDGQAESVVELFSKRGLQCVETHPDLNRLARVISARCTGSPS